jgi:hypothetical protein
MDLAHTDLKIETVERPRAAISHGQPGRAQRHNAHTGGWQLRDGRQVNGMDWGEGLHSLLR